MIVLEINWCPWFNTNKYYLEVWINAMKDRIEIKSIRYILEVCIRVVSRRKGLTICNLSKGFFFPHWEIFFKVSLYVLRQWFSTFITLWLFNLVPLPVVIPNYPKLYMLLHNYNFITVMNHDVTIYTSDIPRWSLWKSHLTPSGSWPTDWELLF